MTQWQEPFGKLRASHWVEPGGRERELDFDHLRGELEPALGD
mgnify:CR=1 FL=1